MAELPTTRLPSKITRWLLWWLPLTALRPEHLSGASPRRWPGSKTASDRTVKLAMGGLVLELLILVSLTGCSPPQKIFEPPPASPPAEQLLDGEGAPDRGGADAPPPDASSGQTKPSNEGSHAREAGSDKAQKGGGAGSSPGSNPQKRLETELSETVNVRQMTSHLRRAERALVSNFRGFLTRKPLEFDASLPAQTLEDARQTWATLLSAERALERRSIWQIIRETVPLLVTLFFVLGLTLLDRQSMAMAHGLQARQHARFSILLTLGLRTLILLAGQLLGPLVLVILTYFPIRAIFGPTTWALLLTSTFWILLAYRLAAAVIEVALGLPWIDLSDAHAQRLHRTLERATQVVTISALLLAAGRAFAPGPELYALLALIFDLIIASLPLALLRVRPAVMALFPEDRQSSLYRLLLSALARNYYWVLLLTGALLGMRAFGYEQASTFILARAYGLFLLLLGAVWGLGQVRRYFAGRIEDLEEDDPQADLLDSIRRLLTIALIIATAATCMRVAALYEPIIILLETPLLTIQRVEFSIFNLISAALIVGSAALLSKIVRAVLNARVYPTLDVDVGVAYAVNTIISYVIVVVGFFLVLIALGVNLSALTVVLASLSVGIGFGLQTLTENLISGFIILFGRAVRKGDYVTVNDVYGRIEAVGARSVVVRTMDNYDLLIPSKDLVGGTIINWTYRDSMVRLHIPVGVTYEADPREVERVLIEAASRTTRSCPSPPPRSGSSASATAPSTSSCSSTSTAARPSSPSASRASSTTTSGTRWPRSTSRSPSPSATCTCAASRCPPGLERLSRTARPRQPNGSNGETDQRQGRATPRIRRRLRTEHRAPRADRATNPPSRSADRPACPR